jgi:hypothetical protein
LGPVEEPALAVELVNRSDVHGFNNLHPISEPAMKQIEPIT